MCPAERAVEQVWAKRIPGATAPGPSAIIVAVVKCLRSALQGRDWRCVAKKSAERWEKRNSAINCGDYSRLRDKGRAWLQNDLLFARQVTKEISC